MALDEVGVKAVVEGLQPYLAAIASMEKSVSRLAESHVRAAKASEQQAASLNRLVKYLEDSAKAAVKFFAAFAVIGIIEGGIFALTNAIFTFNAALEQAQISFTTLLGNREDADQFIQELQRFAAISTFTFEQAIQKAQQLLAFGLGRDQIIPLLRDIGSFVASVGGGAAQIDRVALAIGQIVSKGKLAGEELRQLAEVGINGAKILADTLGKSTDEILALVEARQISADVFVKAFRGQAELKFGDLIEQQAKTAKIGFETVKDSAVLLIGTGFQPLFNSVRDLVVTLAGIGQSQGAVNFMKQFASVLQFVLQILPLVVASLIALLAAMAVAKAVAFVQVLVEAVHILFLFDAQVILTTAAMEALNTVLSSTAGRLALIIIPLTLIDLALRQFTGHGLIDTLTGQAAAADRSAQALKNYEENVLSITDLTKAGFSQSDAAARFFNVQTASIQTLNSTLDELKVKQQAAAQQTQVPFVGSFLGTRLGAIGPDTTGFRNSLNEINAAIDSNQKSLDIYVQKFLEAKPSVEQLGIAVEATGGKVPALTEAFNRQKEALDLLAQSRAAFLGTTKDQSFEEFLAGPSDLATRLKGVVAQLQQGGDVPNNVLKKLRKDLKTAGQGLTDDFQAFGEDMINNAKQAGKDVIKALDALFPDPDEVFRNWLKRLQIQTENIKGFAQNLFYILNQAQQAGITDLRQLGQVFVEAGPDKTAQFAQFLSIDPTAALAIIKPFVEATVNQTGQATLDAYLNIQPEIKKFVTSTFADSTNAGIIASQKSVIETIRDFATVIRSEYERSLVLKPTVSLSLGDQLTQESQANTAANVAADNAAELTRQIEILNQKFEEGKISASEYDAAIAAVKRQLSPSGNGFSAAELNSSAPTRSAPTADTRFNVLGMTPQQLEDQAAKDAEKAEREFEKELARRLKESGAGAIRVAFGAFWDRATTGFAERAAIEFSKLPDFIQPIARQLVQLSQTAQQVQREVLSTGTITFNPRLAAGALFGDKDEISKRSNPFRILVENGDLNEWANVAAQYIHLGLNKIEGQAGKDAQDIIDAVTDAIESRQVTAKERIQKNFRDFFNLRVFQLGGNFGQAQDFFDQLPTQLQEGADALAKFGEHIRDIGNDFDNLSNIDLSRIFDVQFLGIKNPLADALDAAEQAARAAQDIGGWRKLGLAAITAWAAGLQDGTGLAGKTAQQVFDIVKNFISASIAQFDELGSAVETALKNRNDAQLTALTKGLNDQLDRRRESAALEEEIINKESQKIIESYNAQRDAINNVLQFQIESANIISRRQQQRIDDQARSDKDILQARLQNQQDANTAELDSMQVAIDASKAAADAKSKDIQKVNDLRDKAFQHQIDLLNAEKDAIDERLNAQLQARKELDRNERLAEIAAQLQTVTAPSKRKALLDEQTQLQRDAADDQARAAADAAKKNVDIQIASTKEQQDLLSQQSKDKQDADQVAIDSAEKVYKARQDFLNKQLEDQRRITNNQILYIEAAADAEKTQIQQNTTYRTNALQNSIFTNNAYYADLTKKEQDLTAAKLSELKQQEKDFNTHIQTQLDAINAFYTELNKPENIRLEALDILKNPIKTEDILKQWNPQFQVLGQSIGQQMALGYNPDPINKVVTDSFAVLRATERFIGETKGLGEDTINNMVAGANAIAPTTFLRYNQSLQEQFNQTENAIGPSINKNGQNTAGHFMDGIIQGLGQKNAQVQLAARSVFDDLFAQAQAFNLGITFSRQPGYSYQNPDRNIPQYATGAIVTRPHIAQVGEVPEIIAPLSELPKVLGQLADGGGNISVYVTVQGSVTSERDLTQTITNNIIKNQRRNVTSGIQ